jgi:hypothetical protein
MIPGFKKNRYLGSTVKFTRRLAGFCYGGKKSRRRKEENGGGMEEKGEHQEEAFLHNNKPPGRSMVTYKSGAPGGDIKKPEPPYK